MWVAELQKFLYVALPKIIGGLGLVLLNIVLLRFFDTQEFGVLSLFLTAIIILDAVLGSAFDMGIMRLASDPDNARKIPGPEIEKAGVYLKIGLYLILLLLVLPSVPVLANLFFDGRPIMLMSLATLAASAMLLIFRSALTYLQLRGHFRAYGGYDLLQNAVKFLGIPLVLALLGADSLLVLIGMLAGPGIALLLFLFRHPTLWNALPGFPGTAGLRLAQLLGWYLFSFGIAVGMSRMDLYLIGAWGDLSSVGIYSAATVYALIPELLGSYLAVVFAPRIMGYMRAGTFRHIYGRTQAGLLLIACLGYLLVWLGAKPLAALLLPNHFLAALDIILILLPGTLAGMLSYPMTISVVMYLKPRFLVALDLVALPFVLVAYYLAISRYGVEGAAWTTTAFRLVKTAIAQTVAWWLVSDNQAPETAASVGGQ